MTQQHYTVKDLEFKDNGDETFVAYPPLDPYRFYWIDRDPAHGMWRWGLYTRHDIKIASWFGYSSPKPPNPQPTLTTGRWWNRG